MYLEEDAADISFLRGDRKSYNLKLGAVVAKCISILVRFSKVYMCLAVGMLATLVAFYGVSLLCQQEKHVDYVIAVTNTEAMNMALILARALCINGNTVHICRPEQDGMTGPVLLDGYSYASLGLDLPLQPCTGESYAGVMLGNEMFQFRHLKGSLVADMMSTCNNNRQRCATAALAAEMAYCTDPSIPYEHFVRGHPLVGHAVRKILTAFGDRGDAGSKLECLWYYERVRWRVGAIPFEHAILTQTDGLSISPSQLVPVGRTIVWATSTAGLSLCSRQGANLKLSAPMQENGAFGFYADLVAAEKCASILLSTDKIKIWQAGQ